MHKQHTPTINERAHAAAVKWYSGMDNDDGMKEINIEGLSVIIENALQVQATITNQQHMHHKTSNNFYRNRSKPK